MGPSYVGTGVCLVLLVISSHSLPRQKRSISFIGEGTNELATAILQGYVNTERNLAFSPLGYSTLLAILAEGATGETRKQLETALRLPEDRDEIRNCYRSLLERLREKNVLNKPELRNWFYVYDNFAIEQSYKDVLRSYYFTDVKSTERPYGVQVSSSLTKPVENDEVKQEGHVNDGTKTDKEEEEAEDIKTEQLAENEEQDGDDIKSLQQGSILEEAMTLGGMKEGFLIEQAIQEDFTRTEEPKEYETEIKEITINPEEREQATKENIPIEQEEERLKDEHQEDHKLIQQEDMALVVTQDKEEKPVNEEIKTTEKEEEYKPLIENTNIEDGNLGSDGTTEQTELAINSQPETNEDEIMIASEARHLNEQALTNVRHITASLSSNNLVTKGSNGTVSRMIVFNGMFFKGNWAVPFVKKTSPEAFYQSGSEKKVISMMKAQGRFNTGSISELDCKAIELPYEGDRYSLLVLVPNYRSGLSDLIASLTGYSHRDLYAQLVQRNVEVLVPCFNIETITKPIKSFGKFGVTDIFSASASELPGISLSNALYVQELVQLTTVRVDDSGTTGNQITSSLLESRSEDEKVVEKFTVDRPFLYFVRDKIDNVIVVAGKVVDPTQQPTSKFD